MNRPSAKISLIIPVYNAERFLRACLDSATQQTLSEIEFICINDCSTDSSSEILSQIAETDARIRIIEHASNKGEGFSRNTGLDNATGEYVFHLDADDTIPLNALEVLYAEANKNGSDMVKGRYDVISSRGEVQPQNWSSPSTKTVNTNIHESAFLQGIPASHCTYLYKKRFLDEHGIRYSTDLVVGLDLVTLATALVHANSVTLIPDVVYHYHQSDISASRGLLSEKAALDAIRAKAIVNNILIAHGFNEAASTRLKSWNYIITNYWQRMPSSLTPNECERVFSEFRALIKNNNVIPWTPDTPYKMRYIHALILASRDDEALSILGENGSVEQFTDQVGMKKGLEFILTQAPDDTDTLIELGRIERSEGHLEKALELFEKAIRLDPSAEQTRLLAADTLAQLGCYEKARKKLDAILEEKVEGLKSCHQIKDIIAAKESLARSKMQNVSSELETTRAELKSVYDSTSWHITAPLRKLKAVIRRLAQKRTVSR